MIETGATRAARDGAVPHADAPDRVTIERLIALRAAGESLKIATPRVRAVGVGGHLSAFKGRGVEFDESRPYQAGDDPRTMDWRVTARTGKPHTKIFREERNRPVMIWLDLRASMRFGTQGAFKAVRAAEAAAVIAWSAVGNGDRLGGLVFTDGAHDERRPRLGRRAALTLLQLVADEAFWAFAAEGAVARPGAAIGSAAEAGSPAEKGVRAPFSEKGALTPFSGKRALTPFSAADHALQRLARVARPGSLIFLISDFRGLGDDAERHLRQLASHGDVFLVHVYDPIEAELPPPGRYRILVGGRSVSIDTSDGNARARYRAQFEARRARLGALARLPGLHVIDCATGDDPRVVLARHFGARAA